MELSITKNSAGNPGDEWEVRLGIYCGILTEALILMDVSPSI